MASEFLDRLAQILGSKAKLAQALGITQHTLRHWYRTQSIPDYGIDLIRVSQALFDKQPSINAIRRTPLTSRSTTYLEARDRQLEFEATYKDQSTLKAELLDYLDVKNS